MEAQKTARKLNLRHHNLDVRREKGLQKYTCAIAKAKHAEDKRAQKTGVQTSVHHFSLGVQNLQRKSGSG